MTTRERTTSFYHYSRSSPMYKQLERNTHPFETGSWDEKAQSFARVREQQIAEMLRKNEESVQWILERQKRQKERRMAKAWEAVHEKTIDVERWLAKARAEEARRAERRARREAEKIRVYQEELRRMRRQRKSEDEKQARVKAAKDAWSEYKKRWMTIQGDPSERLMFGNIPWPLISRPHNIDGITAEGIREFLFSEGKQSHKEIIRAALLLWHPDRFRRIIERVEEKERTIVEKAVGQVTRILNGFGH